MIRRPPRSPLFPYTTLSGSVGEVTAVRRQPAIELLPIAPLLVERDELHAALADAALEVTAARRQQPPLGGVVPARRSEEHTSELQSPCNLVCRLLLEKKKTH